MNKKLITGVIVIVVLCAFAATQVFGMPGGMFKNVQWYRGTAVTGAAPADEAANDAAAGDAAKEPKQRFARPEITDEMMAQKEEAAKAYKEKLDSFIGSLTEEQKATFDELFGNIVNRDNRKWASRRFAEGTDGEMSPGTPPWFKNPDDSTDESSAGTFKKGFGRRFPGGLPEGADPGGFGDGSAAGGMPGIPGRAFAFDEKALAEYNDKLNAFLDLLTEEQKKMFDELQPPKPEPGAMPKKWDESELAAFKEKWDAFIATLTETQKAAFDELTHGGRFIFKTPGPNDEPGSTQKRGPGPAQMPGAAPAPKSETVPAQPDAAATPAFNAFTNRTSGQTSALKSL